MLFNMKSYFAKQFLLFLLFYTPVVSFGQSIFGNSIDDVDSSLYNPYTHGQVVDPNITVTGIGRGSSLYGIIANYRYDAKSWGSSGFDLNAYFEFSLVPNSGKEIDFISFEYSAQASSNGPTKFCFRSSVDNFTSDIGVFNTTNTTISLSAAAFQNVTSAITFRIYGWAAPAGTGAFSIDDFKFNGIVSCIKPQAIVLTPTSIGCKDTSFDLHWPVSQYADNYFIDVAQDSNFINFISGYHNKSLGNVLDETVSGLIAGNSHYVRLRAANSCETSDDSNTIKVSPPLTVYNGSWSNGNPDANMNVQFLDNYNVNTSLEACSCQIGAGIAVHVDSNAMVKLENGLEIDATSTLTFENGASLVQVNDNAINTGNIIYKRNTSTVADFDYVYWGSPVKNQQLNVLSPNSDKYYSYWNGAWVLENGFAKMDPVGKGYIIRVPRMYTTYKQAVQFEGVPNNGEYGVDVVTVKGNLLGNPYPSAIDADLFMSDLNNKTKINGGLYFWTHNTKRYQDPGNSNRYIYSASDYAVYNLTGLTSGAVSSEGILNEGDIAAGQSFFVASNMAGKLYFTNSMRISASGKNSNFFRTSDTKKAAAIQKNRIWLNLTNDGGAFKQLLLGYITGATNGIDNLYDAETMNGNAFVDFYSVNDSKKFTIQGRRLPFETADEVPLGYQTTLAGTFQISIDNVDGALTDQLIYLEDKITNTVHDLRSGMYSFHTEIGTFNERFVLRYTNTSKLAVDVVVAKAEKVVVSVKNRQIIINSTDQSISSVMVYDLKGSLIYEKNDIDKNEFTLHHLTSASQFIIVMTQLEDGKWVSEEIFCN